MALSGKLRQVNLSQILNYVHLARKTGALSIRNENDGRSACLYFRNGKLIQIALDGQMACLTDALVKVGKLDPDQAKAAHSDSTAETDKEIGLELIRQGFLSQDDIIQGIKAYLLKSVYHLFTWEDGAFRFEPNVMPPAERVTIGVNIEHLAIKGERFAQEWQDLQNKLPDLDTSPNSVPLRRQRRAALIGFSVFALQRLTFSVLVLVSIIYLSFLGLDTTRANTFRAAANPYGFTSFAYGLDVNRGADLSAALGAAMWKTFDYLARLAQGDLGLTARGTITLLPYPIAEIVSDALPKSLGLLAFSLAMAILVGVTLGVAASGRRHPGWSVVILLASTLGVSVPSFFAALLLQLGLIQLSQTFNFDPLPIGGFGWDGHIVLPALVLAARPIAQIARITFVSLNNVLDQDFVRTAQSKGLKPILVMSRHVIRNAATPILTTVGLSLRFSLSSLPVVEFFFGWPGLGLTLLKAISRQDVNLTVALVLCLGAVLILVNLILELCYRLIDPRLRNLASKAKREERGSPFQAIRSYVDTLRELIGNNPLADWLKRRQISATASPFRTVLEQQPQRFEVTSDDMREERRRAWLRGTIGNLPFVAGAILVGALVTIFLFGPALAPHSPYTKQGLVITDGKMSAPPFVPGAIYPWGTDALGRDIMSLILGGAQQTLALAAVVVVARMLVGFLLGALAGWLNGSWVDRLLLSAAEVIAAFPTLLLVMILILALGIRYGMQPFVVALCFVGWGEIMQFVRGEVMSIRPKPFIEGAVSVGLRAPRIVLNHILPNLVPALISFAALETGAVLMLLGELGFIGIFIGGGAFAELEWGSLLYHYSDVPEWGSLLSNVRPYARSYPWTALYPTLAFFIAILGFNLFGEGVRRMVETVGVGITRLINRYTVALAIVVFFGVGWVSENTGTLAFHRRQASAFDGRSAMAYLEALTNPIMDGRALGTSGMDAAADYIARQFQALGLQAAGEDLTFFQTTKRAFESLDAAPRFVIHDGGNSPIYSQDYAEFPSRYFRNMGTGEGQVLFLAMGNQVTGANWLDLARTQRALSDLKTTDQILLTLSEREASSLQEVPRAGVLVVAKDTSIMNRRYTLGSEDTNWTIFGTARPGGQDSPMLWISESTANRLLKRSGHTVAELRSLSEELGDEEVFTLPTGVTVSMEVRGTVRERTPARNVIGHLPGTSAESDDRLIVVMAQYDTPPPKPDGNINPSANDNASGVAVMLEAIRTIQETGYQPYKTFLFVAYSGEGREGGLDVSNPEVSRFLQAKYGFSDSFTPEAVVRLQGVGAGRGNGLDLSAGGSLLLANLFEAAGRQMGVATHQTQEALDLGIVFEEQQLMAGGQEVPSITMSWEGWQETARLPADSVESVSPDKLQQAGRVLSLALMNLGRETQY